MCWSKILMCWRTWSRCMCWCVRVDDIVHNIDVQRCWCVDKLTCWCEMCWRADDMVLMSKFMCWYVDLCWWHCVMCWCIVCCWGWWVDEMCGIWLCWHSWLVLTCWCWCVHWYVDIAVLASICWCVDDVASMCWCIDLWDEVLMCSCIGVRTWWCVVLMCWGVDVFMYWSADLMMRCVDVLRSWCVCVDRMMRWGVIWRCVSWCVDLLMCWCGDMTCRGVEVVTRCGSHLREVSEHTPHCRREKDVLRSNNSKARISACYR
jgi:hypothetical protein